MTRPLFKYGVIQYEGAKPGDPVRFVSSGKTGKPGAILPPRKPTEINAILESVKGTMGYCRIKPQLQAPKAGAEGGRAAGIRIDVPVTAGGSLKIG